MKNLWSKIAALIISLALSQNIKAQELDSLDKKYFLKIEIGQYIFYENWLGKLMQFGLENETSLTKNELLRSKEAFLTNSIMGIAPLLRIEDKLIGNGKPGALTKRLQQAYKDTVLKRLHP